MNGVVTSSFKLNLTVMKIIGLYPFQNYPRLYKAYAYIFYAFAMLPGSILGFIQLFFEKGSDGMKYDDLFTMVVIFLSPKFLSIVKNGHNIRKCIHYLNKDIFVHQSARHKKIIEKCVNICRRNSNIFFFGCVASIFCWGGQLFFRANNELPVNVWLPLALKEVQFFHKCLYINLVTGVIYVGLGCATIDPLIAGCICHASGQLQVLKMNLQNLDKTDLGVKIGAKYIYQKIKNCVVHYNAILDFRFVNEFEDSFSSAIFYQFMESIIVICVCCLQISKLQNFDIIFVVMVNYLCFLLIQEYFYCYYGTILIEENNSLIDAIYMSDWYKYAEESKKALIILMERSKRPLVVTAGTILDLSLETFLQILRRSYSLLAVLKNY